MKKIIVSILLTFVFISGVKAYTNGDYSINIPEGYEQTTINTGDYEVDSNETFIDEEGYTINITTISFTKGSDEYFTEKDLNDLAEKGCNIKEDQRDLMTTNIKEMYGDQLSDEEIEKYVNSYICMGVEKKEIIKSTRNNYRSYHFIFIYGSPEFRTYTNAYIYISNNKVYTLSLTADSLEELDQDKLKNVVDSFTIYNYKEGGKTIRFYEKFEFRIMILSIGIIIVTIIIINRSKNNKKMQ